MLSPAQKSSYRESLTHSFEKHGVTAAYIFGSVANGKTHARSDLDLAVKFAKKPTLKKLLELENDCVEVLKKNVDLVYFNEAPIPLKFRVIQARGLIYAINEKAEVLENAKIMSLYYDFSYYLKRSTVAEINRIATYGI